MKKIIKSICFSLLAFMFAIGSIFLPVGKQSQRYASADSTTLGNTTFISSDIIYFATAFSNQQYSNFINYTTNSNSTNEASRSVLNYSFKLEYEPVSNARYRLRFGIRGFYNESYGLTDGSSGFQFGEDFLEDSYLLYFSDLDTKDYYGSYHNCFLQFANTGTYYTTYGFVVDYSSATSSQPSLVISSIELGSSISNNGFVRLNYDESLQFDNCNIVCYTDTNGFRFIYYIPCFFPDTQITQFYLSYRKYYTSNAFDFSNNGIYQQGILDGRSQGYDSGYNEGYREGTSVGYEDGFENGKIEGALESNNYSFFGLISAVIDAPVKILTSLFNFNFLGVNLWAFFTSILTISLIIFVIRKFMAKG